MNDRERNRDEDREYVSAFPDDGEGQLGDRATEDRDGLDNAVENAEVRTRDSE